MRTPGEVLQALSHLSQQLATGLLQLRIHRTLCQHLGFARLATEISTSIETRAQQLDQVMLRQLQCTHPIDLQNLGLVRVGQTIEEMFVNDLDTSQDIFESALRLLQSVGHSDPATHRLAALVAEAADQHTQHLRQQLELIRLLGAPNFLAGSR